MFVYDSLKLLLLLLGILQIKEFYYLKVDDSSFEGYVWEEVMCYSRLDPFWWVKSTFGPPTFIVGLMILTLFSFLNNFTVFCNLFWTVALFTRQNININKSLNFGRCTSQWFSNSPLAMTFIHTNIEIKSLFISIIKKQGLLFIFWKNCIIIYIKMYRILQSINLFNFENICKTSLNIFFSVYVAALFAGNIIFFNQRKLCLLFTNLYIL